MESLFCESCVDVATSRFAIRVVKLVGLEELRIVIILAYKGTNILMQN